jgi:hypothetical protein
MECGFWFICHKYIISVTTANKIRLQNALTNKKIVFNYDQIQLDKLSVCKINDDHLCLVYNSEIIKIYTINLRNFRLSRILNYNTGKISFSDIQISPNMNWIHLYSAYSYKSYVFSNGTLRSIINNVIYKSISIIIDSGYLIAKELGKNNEYCVIYNCNTNQYISRINFKGNFSVCDLYVVLHYENGSNFHSLIDGKEIKKFMHNRHILYKNYILLVDESKLNHVAKVYSKNFKLLLITHIGGLHPFIRGDYLILIGHSYTGMIHIPSGKTINMCQMVQNNPERNKIEISDTIGCIVDYHKNKYNIINLYEVLTIEGVTEFIKGLACKSSKLYSFKNNYLFDYHLVGEILSYYR